MYCSQAPSRTMYCNSCLSSVCFQLQDWKGFTRIATDRQSWKSCKELTLQIQHAHSVSIEHHCLLPAIRQSDKKE